MIYERLKRELRKYTVTANKWLDHVDKDRLDDDEEAFILTHLEQLHRTFPADVPEGLTLPDLLCRETVKKIEELRKEKFDDMWLMLVKKLVMIRSVYSEEELYDAN